jgi:exodeoxyribonuclease V alpha subunit
LAWRQVELLEPGDGGMRAFLRRWFEREVTGLPGFAGKAGRVFGYADGAWRPGDPEALRELFGHFDRFRILCALREAADLRGVVEINGLLHGWLGELTGEGLRLATPFLAGEPVLMTSNDYRRGIFNGDQGLVLKVAFAGQPRQAAVFPAPEGFRAFPLEPLRGQLEHAFAMTVHKSQGSEYTRVAIVLPRNNHKALTRELLYTGLTRARASVLLLAERERIAYAAGNPSVRDSGLGERLV